MFASGMAAITTMLMEFLTPGDLLLHSEPLYGGTDHFIKHVLPRFNITPVGFAAGATRADVDAALAKRSKDGKLAMVYLETPANPTNALVDIAHVRGDREATFYDQDRKVLVAVDNTFLGPLWQQPLRPRRGPRAVLRHEVPRRTQRPHGRRLPGAQGAHVARAGDAHLPRHHGRARTPAGCCCAVSRR